MVHCNQVLFRLRHNLPPESTTGAADDTIIKRYITSFTDATITVCKWDLHIHVQDAPEKTRSRQAFEESKNVPLTLWRPLLLYGYSYKAFCARQDGVKPSFAIFDIRALLRSGLSVRVPGCQKLQMTA